MHERRQQHAGELALLVAPLDRLVFYPVAEAVNRATRHWPITPNHVTFASLLLGLSVFWWLAKPSGSDATVAVAVCLVRSTLDCLDGVVARTRNMVTAMGRALDEWTDALSIIALVAGLAVSEWRATPGIHIPVLAVIGLASAGILAIQTELYRRRIREALETGLDCVWPDYAAARARRFSSVVAWFGYVADAAKIRLCMWTPDARRLDAEARHLQASAGRPEQRRMLRTISLGADNPVLVLLPFVLLDRFTVGLLAMSAYASLISVATFVLMARHLAPARGTSR